MIYQTAYSYCQLLTAEEISNVFTEEKDIEERVLKIVIKDFLKKRIIFKITITDNYKITINLITNITR